MILSIIIPIYNNAKPLEKLLKILTKNPIDCEIILINDGSTDNSETICQMYSHMHEFIHYVKQSNMGVAAARNNGLKIAKGKFILFLDSDDYPDENITKILTKILAKENPVFLSFGYDLITENNNKIIPHFINTNFKKFDNLRDIKNNFYHYAENNELNIVWNKVFKRDVIIRNNLQFHNIRFGEDVCFVCAYLEMAYGKCIFIEDILYHYVLHSESVTHKYSHQRYEDELFSIHAIKSCAIKLKNNKNQINNLTNLKFKKACLYEIYNLATINCPLNLAEKNNRLKNLYYDFNKQEIIITLCKDIHFSLKEQIILYFLFKKQFWLILIYIELKRRI